MDNTPEDMATTQVQCCIVPRGTASAGDERCFEGKSYHAILDIEPNKVTLGYLRRYLDRHDYRFFFRTQVDGDCNT
jgi:hypothetical protein